MTDKCIQLRGVEVHNLKAVDLDIPHHKLVVFCGVSGSGKTSLALDTLYAEGQRRYIESFSAYTRQFLERMDKPEAERIDGIPPSISVTSRVPSKSSRATIGTATETTNYLRLLFSKLSTVECTNCGRSLQQDSPDTASRALATLDASDRFMVCFSATPLEDESFDELRTSLVEDGFVRGVSAGSVQPLTELASPTEQNGAPTAAQKICVVVDRLTGDSPIARVRDSIETAFRYGHNRAEVIVFKGTDYTESQTTALGQTLRTEIDGRPADRYFFGSKLACEPCGIEFAAPEPRLFNFNSPLGACPACEGSGETIAVDIDRVVPNKNKSLEEGAIAPWNTPTYKHELDALLSVADQLNLPTRSGFRELSQDQVQVLLNGCEDVGFKGILPFFDELDDKKSKAHARSFSNKFKSLTDCPACNGTRLKTESLAVRIGGNNIAELCAMKIEKVLDFIESLELTDHQRAIGGMILEQIQSRLQYMVNVGLGYLTLDRPLKTLSGGESQRVALTSALGSSLVNMLYVLDEPSVGLHPCDTERLLVAVRSLRDRGNSVVVVEHEEAFLRAADHIVEVGPAAGEHGGEITFEGTIDEMLESECLTGEYLIGHRGIVTPQRRRAPSHGRVELRGARGNNLKNLTVSFPLGLMCLVTGVSGAGKSSLVRKTLYPALCRRKRRESEVEALSYDDVIGDGQVDDVILIDQSPIGKSPRSNPVTYIKAFDAIRNVFAETIEARTHNYGASHFSFNVDGGRCTACKGDGFVQIDMQFLADVYMKCTQCQGTRYRPEILDVTYRGKNIAEVLNLSVRQAFSFFRGQEKVQAKLKRLIDVGLEYLRLGQPANTLSAGEAQRLKLACYLASAKRHRTMFIMDEPTTGLHFSDIVKLLDCFEALVSVGHSLIIVEHNLQLMKAADYIIDMGPGASDLGGQVIATGTPEEIAQNPDSRTGPYLAEALSRDAEFIEDA
ncbi:MAG: excinuclease ABC subunit UvrA [Planctomycetales bacterium]|nr:excinuclease ABC subunit UvrA [Planctomycetales bacterium]